MYEVEFKFRLRDLEACKRSLEQSGWRFSKPVVYRDTYLDCSGAKLRSADHELRIREVFGHDGGLLRTLLTAKGARLTAGSETKMEHQTSIGSATETLKLLELLGFAPWLTYEKRVEAGELTHGGISVEAALVTVPELTGAFMEIETTASSNEEIQGREDLLMSLAAGVGLLKEDIDLSYYTKRVINQRLAKSDH